jgi:hypothetical protein
MCVALHMRIVQLHCAILFHLSFVVAQQFFLHSVAAAAAAAAAAALREHC